jgi:hypothetical protein
MSSSGKTYLVVAYDHTDGTFTVDTEMSLEKFRHDTWDSVEEEWCHLDKNDDMWQDTMNLEWQLNNLLAEDVEDE